MSKLDARGDGPSAVDPATYAVAQVSYDKRQRRVIDELEHAVRTRLAPKPKRLVHSLSVAATAEAMAVRYGVDPWEARVAGILHDWDKVLSGKEQLRKARAQGVDLGVPLELVVPLLHGITAAGELGERYPWLPSSVLRAIARHTIGAADMSALDMVVFTADIIEPGRAASAPIEATRALVAAQRPLFEAYWSAFARGIAYVVESGRYLYPGTIDIYNETVLRLDGARSAKRTVAVQAPSSPTRDDVQAIFDRAPSARDGARTTSRFGWGGV